MDKKNVPQDEGVFGQWHGINYAVDESGRYVLEKTSGWEPVNTANEQAWEAVGERIAFVREKMEKGELSPVAYYMEKNLMDVKMLSNYIGISRWRVKRHLDAGVFRRLSHSLLERYAKVFGISVEQLEKGPEND